MHCMTLAHGSTGQEVFAAGQDLRQGKGLDRSHRYTHEVGTVDRTIMNRLVRVLMLLIVCKRGHSLS